MELTPQQRHAVLQSLNRMPYNEWHEHTEWTQKEWACIIQVCQTQVRGELQTNGTDKDHSTITKIIKHKRPAQLCP